MKKTHFTIFSRSILVLFYFTSFLSVFAQTRTVTGTVVDANGDEIIGASVVVRGTTTGILTDIDGNFSLIVPQSATTLTVSYVGMTTQEVMITNTPIRVILTENVDVTSLDELVVIGYGVVKRSDLTGSVSAVSTKELTKNPAMSAAQALQGRTSGVLVTPSSEPGKAASIRVRGVGSINNSSEPIYIVDGMRMANIEGIHPQDIESLQVLKDASASAIYGANGSNGVIIITTKRGQSGKPEISFNSYLTYNRAPKKYDLMNADQYATFYSNIHEAASGNIPYPYTPEFREQYYGAGWNKGTDWQDEIFRNSISQNYHLGITGGGEKSNYSVSLAYKDDQANVIKHWSKAYTIRANSDFQLSKYVKIGENFSARFTNGQVPTPYASSVWSLEASPLMKILNPDYKGGYESMQAPYWRDANGDLHFGVSPNEALYPTYENTFRNDKPNPLAQVMAGESKTYGLNALASAYLQIDFTDWLMFKTTPSADITYSRGRFWMPTFGGNRASAAARLVENYAETVALNIENQLLFRKLFNDVHNVQVTLVQESQQINNNFIDASGSGFNFETLPTMTNALNHGTLGGINDYKRHSYLGRLIYDYKSKYYLTASTRRDAVSNFAENHRSGWFNAFSLAWRISEDFLTNVRAIDDLKLRFGYGQTGNSDLGGLQFGYVDKIMTPNAFSPVFGEDQVVVPAQYIFYGMASPFMTWETAEMLNIGVDANLFNNRLLVAAEYYVKNVNDLLIKKPISKVFGRVDADPWVNAGKIQNKGIDVGLTWRDKVGNFEYGIISNLTTVHNRVKDILGQDIISGNNRTRAGYSIGALYGYVAEGIIQSTNDYINYPKDEGLSPEPGDLKFADLNSDGKITSDDRTIIGKTIPSYSYSVGFELGYKNFDFNIFLYGVGDFDIFNMQRAGLSSIVNQEMDHNKLADWATNHWTSTNPSTKYVRADYGNINRNDRISSFWVEDGSFLRIKDIQLGYRVPKDVTQRLGLSNLRAFINASNLYCFTSYSGRDPEGLMSVSPIASGTDRGGYTVPKTFSFGLQVGF